MTDAETTARKQRGRPWPKGTSGNPTGRPAGSRHKSILTLEALIEGEGEAVVRAMVKAALSGDVSAGRILLDRLVPARGDRPLAIALPPLQSPADAVSAHASIAQALAAGAISAREAGELAKVIDGFVQAATAHDLEARIVALENQGGRNEI